MQVEQVDRTDVATCSVCRGTGITFTREDVPKPEAATFCSVCDAGRKRWEATLRTLQDFESGNGATEERVKASARGGAPPMYY